MDGLWFSTSHEWVRIEADGSATIGISDFAVKSLTDLVYLELPKVGKTLKAGENFGVVESVKSANDLVAPVGGTVSAINSALADDLPTLSDDPFGKGWLIKLSAPGNPADAGLMNRPAYDTFCASESH